MSGRADERVLESLQSLYLIYLTHCGVVRTHEPSHFDYESNDTKRHSDGTYSFGCSI